MTTSIAEQNNPARSDSEIADFIEQMGDMNPQLAIDDAGAKIYARHAQIGRMLANVAKRVIEVGLLYEAVAEHIKRIPGASFEQWCQTTPYDSDTIRNFRNTAKRFRDELESSSDGVLGRVRWGAVYMLAAETVPLAAGAWFFEQLARADEDGTPLLGSTKLAMIAKDEDIRQRYEDGELNLDQAYSLAVAFNPRRKTPPPNTEYIIELARDLHMRNGQVVDMLNDRYLDWIKASDIERPNKTFADIRDNEWRLIWADPQGATNDVALRDATPGDFELYMQYRRFIHRTQNVTQQRQRATARVERVGNRVVLTLLDGNALPPGFNAETVQVDLIYDMED